MSTPILGALPQRRALFTSTKVVEILRQGCGDIEWSAGNMGRV
jgi:hypothetical protein